MLYIKLHKNFKSEAVYSAFRKQCVHYDWKVTGNRAKAIEFFPVKKNTVAINGCPSCRIIMIIVIVDVISGIKSFVRPYNDNYVQ